MLGFWLLLILLLLWLAVLPWWPYSRGWGYWPGGGLALLLIAWLFLIWFGFIAFYWPWVGPAAV